VLLAASNSFASTIIVNSGSLGFTNDFNLGNPANRVILTNGGGLRLMSGSLVWNPARTVDLTNGGGAIITDAGSTLFVSNAIVGIGSLTKAGPGTLMMVGAPTYTGGTFVANGVLSIGNEANAGGAGRSIYLVGGTLQVRDVVLNDLDAMTVNWGSVNGTLHINNNGNRFTVTNDLDGLMLAKSGQGLLVLGGDNSSGSLTSLVVQSGPLLITNGASLATLTNLVQAGGALWFGSNIVTAGQPITLNGAGALGNDGALRSIGGVNTNAGPITLAGAARISANSNSTLFLSGAISNGTNMLTFGNFGDIIVSSNILGTGGLTKERSGTLTLRGYATNAYGGTTIEGGTLRLDYSVGSVVSDLVASNSVLTLGAASFIMTTGGTLVVNGPASGAITQSFARLVINPGINKIIAQTNGGDIFLNLDGISRAVGGGMLDLTLPGGAGEITSTVSNNYAGLLGLAAPGLSGTNVLITIGGTDWATATNASGVGYKITNYSGYTDVAIGSSIASDSNTNVRIGGTTAGAVTLAAAVTSINTLAVTNAAATTNDLEATKTLRLGQTGGILLTPGSGGLTIGSSVNDGLLTAGGADNTAGELVLINNSGGALTVNSVITSNGTGAITVTVNGHGEVNFYGSNAYNQTFINGGRVTFYGTNTVTGPSPLTQRGGTVIFDAGSTNA
ncbi:MAG: hypothetical protein FJ388_17535, partial [Verrucomicrobia bacterium]|nr:hypothetical protein [Verrucomicrobiota bacterium]